MLIKRISACSKLKILILIAIIAFSSASIEVKAQCCNPSTHDECVAYMSPSDGGVNYFATGTCWEGWCNVVNGGCFYGYQCGAFTPHQDQCSGNVAYDYEPNAGNPDLCTTNTKNCDDYDNWHDTGAYQCGGSSGNANCYRNKQQQWYDYSCTGNGVCTLSYGSYRWTFAENCGYGSHCSNSYPYPCTSSGTCSTGSWYCSNTCTAAQSNIVCDGSGTCNIIASYNYDYCGSVEYCSSGSCISGYCGVGSWGYCGGTGGASGKCQKGRDRYNCNGGGTCAIWDTEWQNVGYGNVCIGSGSEVTGDWSNFCGTSGWNGCYDKCNGKYDKYACNSNVCNVDTGADGVGVASPNKVCSGGSYIDASSSSLACDSTTHYYCSSGSCSGYYRYAECNGEGGCGWPTNYQQYTAYASNYKVLTSSCGNQDAYEGVQCSSTVNSCGSGSCSGTKKHPECYSSGSCDTSASTYYQSETVYADYSYTLTSSCGAQGTTYCGYSGYNDCHPTDECRKKYDAYRCDGGVGCSIDVADLYSYMSASGYVCSGSGTEVSPSGSINCDTTVDCTTGACSASRYYRGCTSGGSSCVETNKQSYTAWNAGSSTAISETNYKVGTTCSTSGSQVCDGTNHCVGDDYYDGYQCNGGGTCNVDYNAFGCCGDSACSPPQSTCNVTSHGCWSTCTSGGLNQDWGIYMPHECTINDNTDIGTGKIIYSGSSGFLRINATVNASSMTLPPSGTTVFIHENGHLRITGG